MAKTNKTVGFEFLRRGQERSSDQFSAKSFLLPVEFQAACNFYIWQKKEIIKGIVRLTRFNILFSYALAVIGIAVLTSVMFVFGGHVNPTTVALVFLLFILFLATAAGSKPALVGHKRTSGAGSCSFKAFAEREKGRNTFGSRRFFNKFGDTSSFCAPGRNSSDAKGI